MTTLLTFKVKQQATIKDLHY